MNFKEWLTLHEMLHVTIPSNIKINGISGDGLDFRFEDWGKGFNPEKGRTVAIRARPPLNYNSFKAQTKEGWLVYSTPSQPQTAGGPALRAIAAPRLYVVRQTTPEIDALQSLDPSWWRFAMITKGNDVVKEPEWPRGPKERQTLDPIMVDPL